jgi:hypothetical protein
MPAEPHRDEVRFYSIWLGGARVGTARESEVWSHDGMHLRREEKLVFLRGDEPISMSTTIDIDADASLVASHVRWAERMGGSERAAVADHDATAWHVSSGERLDGHAVPAELVPLIVRRDGQFHGAVFLPARGFVVGTGRMEAIAPGRLIARLALGGDAPEGTVVEATIDLDADRMPSRVVDGEGVIAMRVTESQAAEWFPAVDLIAATSIPISGARTPPNRIALVGDLALPALPGQQARVSPTGVEVELDAALSGALPDAATDRDRSAEIRSLVAAVRARITPDLGAGRTSTRDAAAATEGDCTTFALAYAALASQRRIATRVVTGFRVDDSRSGARLIRHRWAVSWTGKKWIAIDAAFGAVPAGGNLIGLAVHDADDAGLVAGEAALTQVRGASWN